MLFLKRHPGTFLLTFLISVPVPIFARDILPTNVSVITREDIAGRPMYTVADVLDSVPGLDVERDGSRGTRTRLKIRGASETQRTLVLIDGLPLTNEFDGEVDLTQIPLPMVERIEVTRGGSSVAYGAEASGGVVNIITTDPDRKGLTSEVATAVGRDGFKDSNGRFRGRSRWGDITYAGDREASGGFQNSEDFKAESHFGKVARSFNGNGFWGADYFYQESRVGTPNGTSQPLNQWNGHLEQEGVTPLAQREQNLQQAKLRFASPQIAAGNFYLTLKQGWRDLELFDTSDGPAVRDEETVSSLANLNYRRHGFEAGVQAQRFKRVIFSFEEQRSHQNSAYLLQKWTPGKWTVVPGLRYDKPAESDGLWNPRLTLIHAGNDQWLVSASASRAFRKPTFDELFAGGAATGNPDLEPEKSVNYDAGIEWSPRPYFLARVTGFRARVKDLITVGSANRYENAGRETNTGVETEMSIGNRKSRLSANWTAQRSQSDTPFTNGFVPSAMTPRHLVAARYSQALPWALTMTNEVRYQSEQFQFDNRAGIRVPSYTTWNARFSFRLWQADLYTAVENITNRRYADTILTALSPQPARTFWGGLSIRFVQ